ncbi:oligopeptide transport system substrate-binding protein [Melghiribacillus thermohalophilus]|uniref:Oligopeptide transport system substrate-binding protein n=1 Tax=Melghiribacillus thermohalophilus TaxID=1324956 RepID=A0A4R3NH65_9BACI|nr:peptide ABC transporter substrate-binding protein [Melghiribacillus thermohalophilus]TCT26507.1 oligopeptide transport system substrate-binding protein [Melghiribacillus thermohalophilus]
MKRRFGLKMVLLFGLMLIAAGCNFSGSEDTGTQDSGSDQSDQSSSDDADNNQNESVINLTANADIPTLDSALAHDSIGFTVLNNIMEGLYRSDENHQPQLALAEDHQVSDDGLVHTFILRDAVWSNGDPVTAEDFEYAWKRVFEKAGSYNVMFETVGVKNASAILAGEKTPDELGVESLDEKTLQVTLEHPSPLFKQLLTFPTFFPVNQSYVEEMGEDYALEADNLVFNGPFVLADWKHDQGWTYKKNPDYWDQESVQMDQINVEVVKETSTAVNLYETEAVDRILLSSAYVENYKDSEDFISELRPGIVFMRFSHKDEFANPNIRRAISLAIDKKGLTSVILADGSRPLNGLVPYEFSYSPDGQDFRELNGEFNVHDVDQAQEFWQKGLDELGIDGFDMELTAADNDYHVKTAEYIKDQLEKNLPGIGVDIKLVPFSNRLELEKAIEYDMVISTWGPDYNDPMTYVDMWVTDGPANRMEYSNPAFDEMVKQAYAETDAAARYELMLEAERVLLEEDFAIVPLYQNADAILMRPHIKGMIRHPSAPEFDYKHAYIE